MFLNYIKLSLRQMARNPFFTFINLAGLSIGFAVFFVLWQYAQSELDSDKQWKDWQRIARHGYVWERANNDGNWQTSRFGTSSPSIGPKLADDYDEVESFTRIMYQTAFSAGYLSPVSNRLVVSIEKANGSTRYFNEYKAACADANFFDFFSFPMLEGDVASVLEKTNAIVLSESQSKKFFGDEPAAGQTLLLNDQLFEVTGVFRDLPNNTHMDFDMVISNNSFLSNWQASAPASCLTFVKSKKIIDWRTLENKINQPDIIQKYYGELFKVVQKARATNLLEPLNDVPFSDLRTPAKIAKSKTTLLTFQMIGTVVLLLAVLNYIILTTARTTRRFKEVAARKVIGGASHDFFKQFFTETWMMFTFAFVLAGTWVQLFKGPLQLWLQINLANVSYSVFIVFGLAAVASIIVCSAYPTYMALTFQPRTLITKSLPKRGRRILSLTLVQYTIAVVLMIFCFMVYQQISFLLNKSLGFNKDNVIVIDAPVTRSSNYENEIKSFVSRIAAEKSVEMVTISTSAMGDTESTSNLLGVQKQENDMTVFFDTSGGVDENFIPFYNLELVIGRNFMPDEKGNVVILSEGALSRLGFDNASNAVGSSIDVWDWNNDVWKKTEIIGVIKGYRLRPFFKYGDEFDNPDRGIGLTYRSGVAPHLTVERVSMRVTTDNVEEAMASIRKEYEAMFPGNVFNWYFLDDSINKHYRNDKVWRNRILLFTGLAIGIACLGLLGMISNKIVEKTKEIGIRKILGAPLHQIAHMLLNSWTKQVMMASVISIPIVMHFTQLYLQKFSERIELQWWHFALPVVILVSIMLGTVATIVWKAANNNPVDALKYE
jgi:putative ABC transport system permease protein